jgi:hypothetical protein
VCCMRTVRFNQLDLLEVVCGAVGSLNPLWWASYEMILSPARLPFHHSGTRALIDNEQSIVMQECSNATLNLEL